MGLFSQSIVIAVAFMASSAFALPASVKPAEISTEIRARQPYGQGSMKRFLITAYDASLWTDAPHWSMQAPFALTIRYNFAFSSNSIVSRALKEMKHDDSRLGDDTLVRYRALMSGLFPDVRSGDEITGLYAPGGTIRFFYNGQPTGHVDDVAFANAFFGIWLSSETSEPDLRAQLLQLHP